jgi:outer membrane lipoprotein-sorting protein
MEKLPITLIFVLVLAFLTGCVATPDNPESSDESIPANTVETTADEVIDKMEAELGDAELEYTVEVNSTTGGAHRLVRKGNRTKIIQTNPEEGKGDIFVVSDEYGIWDYDSSKNHYYKERLGSLNNSNFPLEILKTAMNTTNVSLRGTEAAEGETAYILRFTGVEYIQQVSEVSESFDEANATYWVSSESWLPVRASVRFSDERTVVYTNFTFTNISDTAFKPPEDARFLGTGPPMRIPYIAEVVATEEIPENATTVDYENSPASERDVVTNLLEDAYENGNASVKMLDGSRADEDFSEVMNITPSSPAPLSDSASELAIPGNYIRYRNKTIFLSEGPVPL